MRPTRSSSKIEQVVRLIRSKGVGVYFVTQNPLDIPDAVLGQLGNRVQHALRAFTPRDQKAVQTAAETMRANPAFDTEAAITELAVGEALVSCSTRKAGRASWNARGCCRPRRGSVRSRRTSGGGHGRRRQLRVTTKQAVDRESAYEKLTARTTHRAGGRGRRHPWSQAPAAESPGAGSARQVAAAR